MTRAPHSFEILKLRSTFKKTATIKFNVVNGAFIKIIAAFEVSTSVAAVTQAPSTMTGRVCVCSKQVKRRHALTTKLFNVNSSVPHSRLSNFHAHSLSLGRARLIDIFPERCVGKSAGTFARRHTDEHTLTGQIRSPLIRLIPSFFSLAARYISIFLLFTQHLPAKLLACFDQRRFSHTAICMSRSCLLSEGSSPLGAGDQSASA